MAAFASTGNPGRIGDVHIDVIEDVSAPRRYAMTNTRTESGAPVGQHRQRETPPISVSVLVSDSEPVFGARLLGLWESDHARKTRDRIRDYATHGTAVSFYDGREFVRPTELSGINVWVVNGIDRTRDVLEGGVWRATIILAERPQFSTSFTGLDPDVDPSAQDLADGVTDSGTQSTEAIPEALGAGIVLN